MAPPKKPATLPASTQSPESLEGDYAPSRPLFHTHAPEPNIRVEPLQLDFLLRLADALNTTLDLNTLMHRVADLVRAVIDYRIFAILLINDRTHELWMRFQTGHTTEIERMRIKLGRGVVGQAALQRKSILVEDVTKLENYINANPHVLSELAVPLIVKNKVIGVLDLQSEAPAFFTPDHQRLLELTASRMAVAVENARLYTRVSRQAQTLTVLHEISHEITSILDPDDLLERIGALLKRVIDFQMFTILLWNDKSEQLEHRFSTRYGERVIRQRTVLLGQGIIGTAAQQRTPILSPDVRKDSRYFAENPETRSELSVPLIYKGKVIGVIDLEHTRVNYYNEDHQRTLTTLASQIAISIANARLYQRISEEEQRMERDLNMAREVQLRLMPAAPPQPANAEIATSFNAARSIGGDVYDFLDYGPAPNPDLEDPDAPPTRTTVNPSPETTVDLSFPGYPTRTVIALGDVSGKAAPAALYAALVSGLMRSLAPRRLPPAQLLSLLNAQLQERKLDSQYVTMLMSLWDDRTRTLRVANAGSVQPMLITRATPTSTPESLTNALEVTTIPVEGFPLGLFPIATYDETLLQLAPGDFVLFFSDGIVDAENSRGEQFGSERLSTLLQHHPTATQSAKHMVAAILEAVATHQSGTEHFDDETLIVLHIR
ncbi:GAF domain-containing protein [Granulicella tundricola]|uniref:Protein serine/threonine phosphatase with GAF(S) sensor(S) n=1 Tax=Granulicella tundricola (strain ATCC BAA-1859 / DSM 23138 / MP5ACTX9) TaxID=1198114 RepID=E8WZH0_GRATM|nr:SpoIIE family protein phosphatase [Granulicella tundricola]ADW68858.1 protein serine/threonine phosphatase with GAF(s) sensor(s) [Granulicella tundricola MP5ACTX9]